MRPLTLLSCLVALLLSSCEWVADPMNFSREEVPRFRAKVEHPAPPQNPSSLKVMAWNVKYGACRVDFWFDFWGDRVQLSATEVNDCLSKVAQLVKEYDPDVLLTSEIEAGSKRSAYVDMVQFLLDNTNLRYAAYASTWDARYVPSEGLGRINLGNAIHSRYPIVKAERIRQADRTDQDPLTATFYIKRAIARAELDLGDRAVAVYAVHTEAYDQDGTKQKQIAQIHELVKAEPLPFLLGGDFNELPPVCDEKADAGSPDGCDGKLRLAGFLDERASAKGTAFEQPPYTPSVMKRFYDDFNPFIPLARYGVGDAQQRQYFTHSVLGPDSKNDEGVPGFWNRTLDYLFVRKTDGWRDTDVIQGPGRLGVTQDAIRLSDHAPVAGTWELR
ncbi:MAG: endonuclease/exonuclease/phosphatase family protein [Myxococcaceae bacterium]|jgi:endonuclease/exonuclease/phosphatase family metal-dependent hydrolase|nr:endonuclease/exonuclease/phosphatase family protein [Myxococcaceae bacterium]MCA3016982.1 endonuclease/exonuclease/phosphatase family protein [Myxococcaceae bacterium]